MKNLFSNTLFKLLLGVIVGICIGFLMPRSLVGVLLSIRHICGQFIFFLVPLIILGFVAPSIAKLQDNASHLLSKALIYAYVSTVGAGFFALILGYLILPSMQIMPAVESIRELPEMIFRLDIPPIMGVMSALVLAVFIGLSVVWIRSDLYVKLLTDFQEMVLHLVKRILIPLLPFFIAANFAILAYEGAITEILPIFLKVLVVVLVGHFVWLALLYSIAGLVTRRNPILVLKHYGPAYLTAVGTMSSAATLGIALECMAKSKQVHPKIWNFSIPLFANIHLCGSVLTEVFFVMTVSLIIYGALPSFTLMVMFVFLLAVFGIGAPGVPGGTVVASLGLIVALLGFNESATALLITIFALQDSFGTACNITGDGALTLMLSKGEEQIDPNMPADGWDEISPVSE